MLFSPILYPFSNKYRSFSLFVPPIVSPFLPQALFSRALNNAPAAFPSYAPRKHIWLSAQTFSMLISAHNYCLPIFFLSKFFPLPRLSLLPAFSSFWISIRFPQKYFPAAARRPTRLNPNIFCTKKQGHAFRHPPVWVFYFTNGIRPS